jgi:16S rRNA (cytosine967-C5)-methyltransferase
MDKPREKALQILCRIEEGTFADGLLEQARRQFEHRDNAFIHELVYGVLRTRSRLDWTLDRFSAQPVSKTDIRTRNILRLGAYQMLFLDRVPVSAAVNTCVELAKEHGRKNGYVNGLLRNLDRKRGEIGELADSDPEQRLSLLHSHPAWLVKRWVKRFGLDRTEELLRDNNRPSPLVIRTNTLRTSREELKAALEPDGAEVVLTQWSPLGLELRSGPELRSLKAYQAGWFLVQDEAAQLIGFMLDPRPGEAVLDACAAPGGKATHLAALMQNSGTVIALESDPGRISRIGENSDRLGTTIVRSVLADAIKYREGSFDKVLIDAPCSGLGVLRRHPDGRWSKKEELIRERAKVQREILKNCASLLKPGGALVYATCTTEPEENEQIIASFLAETPGQFRIDDPRPLLPEQARKLVDDDRFFRTFPAAPEVDGFFGARLLKNL